MTEEFTIKAQGDPRTWTRATLKSAKDLADSITRVEHKAAVVTLTENGWIEYVATPADESDVVSNYHARVADELERRFPFLGGDHPEAIENTVQRIVDWHQEAAARGRRRV